MGTSWEVTIWDKLSVTKRELIERRVIEKTNVFDETFSRFIDTSWVCRHCTKTGRVRVPPDFVPILRMYFFLYRLSNGKFTPLVGQTLVDLGYDTSYSLREKEVIHEVPDLDATVSIIDDRHIFLHKPALFDFGGLGKGYCVDKISDYLRSLDIRRFLVNGSGDMFYEGDGKPIVAGLEDPLDASRVIGTIEMWQGAFCGSGINRRSWGSHHHIIDPQSFESNTAISATWVSAASTALADALATALFLTPPESFQGKFSFEYLILNDQRKVKRSRGLGVTLFSA